MLPMLDVTNIHSWTSMGSIMKLLEKQHNKVLRMSWKSNKVLCFIFIQQTYLLLTAPYLAFFKNIY